MTLADDLESAPPPRMGKRRCLFQKVLDAFPDEAVLIMEKCQPGKKVTTRRTHVMRVLADNGYDLGDSTIERHVSRTCVCFR